MVVSTPPLRTSRDRLSLVRPATTVRGTSIVDKPRVPESSAEGWHDVFREELDRFLDFLVGHAWEGGPAEQVVDPEALRVHLDLVCRGPCAPDDALLPVRCEGAAGGAVRRPSL